ncbi:PRC-barrel domain-containing protein [Novosphingobium sp.]|uniref:PRC-barrel domain-containing protein n=1 Tax=Novosphingobium sp. TaxID=1874826 RepID=UPI002617AE43|nr:PRC-barrel domain-containing protein [Novosphingobium sp.]
MMTAANLGARVTGWGFAVFTLGSLCWIAVGLSGGQTSLVVANGALFVINAIGVWRWLGLQSAREDGAGAAKQASRRAATPTLFPATELAGMPVVTLAGEELGLAVEALVECLSAQISYVVVSTAGSWMVDEILRAVPCGQLTFQPDRLVLALSREAFAELSPLPKGDWPAAL